MAWGVSSGLQLITIGLNDMVWRGLVRAGVECIGSIVVSNP